MELEQVPVLTFSKASDVPWKRDEDSGTICEGSYSVVFRAMKGDEIVAIKDVTAQNRSGAEEGKSVVKATMRELQLLRICRHPHILEYVAAYTNERVPDHIYIVTKPWADMNLGDFLGFAKSSSNAASCDWWQGTSFAKCCLLFRGLLDGLAYLHRHQIFHKDIKPENILLLGPHPILADFGLSKLYRPNAPTKFTNSTYWFLAPEQITHESSTLRCDVFAMGCCLVLVRTLAVLGNEGIVDLEGVLYMDGTSSPFGDPTTIRRMLNILKRRHSRDKADFWRQSYLDLLIRDMVLEVPSERPSARAAAKSFTSSYCEATFADEVLSLPSGAISVSEALDSAQFEKPDIAMLNTIQRRPRTKPRQGIPRAEDSDDSDDSDKSDDTISSVKAFDVKPEFRVGFLKPSSDGSPADATSITATIDTGSVYNLISARFLDVLKAADRKLEIRKEDMDLMSLGGTIRIRRSTRCRLVYPLRNEGNTEPSVFSIRFYVIDTAEAFFDVLLGLKASENLLRSHGGIGLIEEPGQLGLNFSMV